MTLTYGELEREVARMVTVLRELGVEANDAVALYTGWLPETVVIL
jgi:acetyl-CoA synthetase